MDEIYLVRLNKFITNIKCLASSSRVHCALKSWSDDDLEQARILSSKLQSVLNRFNGDLYQYFNTATNPNADDISVMTTEQLDGEEALAELNARIDVRKIRRRPEVKKPNLMNNTNKRFKAEVTAFNKTHVAKRKFNFKEWKDRQGPEQKRKKISCLFCNEDHFNDECKTVRTISQRKLKLKNRCFNCLRLGHNIGTCRSKHVTCAHCGKKGLHNRALCPDKEASKIEPTNTLHIHVKESTVLQTAIVDVKNPKGISRKCRVLLDSGSMRSYITQEVSDDLELEAKETNHLLVFTFGSTKPQEIDSSLVKFHILSRTNKQKITYANVVPSITRGVSSHSKELDEWKHRNNYLLADDGSLSDRVDILIGNDYYHSIIASEKVKLRENLYLVNSDFGWILSGKTKEKYDDELSALTYFQASYETKLNEPDLPLDNGSMKVLWDLESIGITDSPNAKKDEEAIKHFNETATFTEGRYCVSWPWKEYPPELPTNYGLAYGRLVGLMKRLDSKTLSTYKQTFDDQLRKGIIEVVPDHRNNDHPIHFLAHHGVLASGKALRIVFDASAKTKDSKSLNECLYCGPMMLDDLTGLLLRFRCHAIAITADVEKAFLQMSLKENDRDVTRFLWLKDTNQSVTEDNIIQYRFVRVPFGIICSPFLLNATIRHHLQNSTGKYVRQLADDIYVDNVLTGVETDEEALNLYEEGKTVFSEISMNLREWSSNSKCLMDRVPDVAEGTDVKVLGLNWNINSDTIQLRTKVKMTHDITKRGILKTIAEVYDPCGFSAPIILPAKLLLQELWKLKVKWDALLPTELNQRWKIILKEMKQIETICLPRNIVTFKEKEAQIHCFTDSSTVAYAAVVYVVQGGLVNFIIGKTRLVPIKDQENLRIPRLELLGVLIGSRLVKYVLRYTQLNITRTILWTDSQIVIDWFHSEKLLEPFVSKRLREIKHNKDLVVRHVPSELNPADSATRPTSSEEERKRWLTGPDFLKQDSGAWPRGPQRVNCLLTGEDVPNTEELSESRGMSEKDFQEESEDLSLQGDALTKVNGEMVVKSEIQVIVELQKQYFSNEVKGKETNLTRNLGLFKDVDGVLRCGGRLTHSDLSYEAKHPIILPKDCDYSNEVIKDIHETNYHVGVSHTLSLVRQRFWIPHGRAQVQKVVNKCPRCRKHGGGPYALPTTPALPPERVRYETPFTYVGVDYFGPMLVRNSTGNEKRWICLITCLVIRAVHLEVVKDMSTEECALAFRRFIATRGVPDLIVSDNASQFRLLSEVLTVEGLSEKKIRWKFIPQLAPWHGGVYERLVAVVKHCLKRTLLKHMLGDNQLLTIIKEVESVVNTRPLTYVGADFEHVLKPADFLTPGKCLRVETLMDHLPISGSIIKQQLIEGWKRGNIIMNEYKEMFINRYLMSLRERYSNSPKQVRVRSHHSPQIGDIVQIKGELRNREGWKVGKVIELVKGSDNLCRVAKVKVGNSIFTRSIAHLYPLEVDEEETIPDSSDKSLNLDVEGNVNVQPFSTPLQSCPKEDERVSSDFTIGINDDQIKDIEINLKERSDSTQDTREKLQNACIPDDLEVVQDQTLDNIEVETSHNDVVYNHVNENKQQRVAAVQALEKIHKWTRDLMSTIN